MPRIRLKIPLSVRLTLFAILGLSWVTGTLFFVLKKWFEVEGDFGPEPHPWLNEILQLHGAGAFLMMIFFGVLIGTHIPAGYASKRHLKSGFTLIACVTFLIISAYILYYISGSWIDYRERIALVHAFVGFSLPFVLTVHIISAIRDRRQAAHARFPHRND